jgi:hypothetical protein
VDFVGSDPSGTGHHPEWVRTTHPSGELSDDVHASHHPSTSILVITVRGVAGPSVRRAFADVDVTDAGDTTLFRSQNADQPAMHGLLQRMENLGLEVVDVHLEPVEPAPPT